MSQGQQQILWHQRGNRQRGGTAALIFLIFVFIAGYIGAVIGLNGPSLFTMSLLFIGYLSAISLIMFLSLRNRVYYALAFLILTVTFQGDRFGITLKPDGIAVALLACTLLLSAPRRYFLVSSYPLAIPLVGFLLANIIASIVNSPVLIISIKQSIILIARVATFFLVVMAVQQYAGLRRKYSAVVATALVGQTVLSLLAVAVYRIWPTPLVTYGQNGGTSASINGFFLEPNLFGIFALCVLTLISGMYLYCSSRELPKLLGAGMFAFLGLILSYTRSAWLGLILVLGCLWLALIVEADTRARRRFSLIIVVGGLLFCVLLIVLLGIHLLGFELDVINRLVSIVDAKSPSAEVRTIAWQLAFIEIRQHPLIGSGPLSFPYVNGWLFSSVIQTLHDSGVLGLFFMLYITLGSLWYTWRGYTLALEDQDKGILLGYLVAQVGLFFTSQFSSFFWGGFTWVWLGLAVGHSQVVIKQRYIASK